MEKYKNKLIDLDTFSTLWNLSFASQAILVSSIAWTFELAFSRIQGW